MRRLWIIVSIYFGCNRPKKNPKCLLISHHYHHTYPTTEISSTKGSLNIYGYDSFLGSKNGFEIGSFKIRTAKNAIQHK